MKDCIFCKIIAGESPAKKKFEDEEIIIFEDIEPKAKIHLLCVPKDHFADLTQLTPDREELLGHTFKKISTIDTVLGFKDGYRIIINQGKNGGQTVPHLHIHLLGGEVLPF